MCVHHRFTVNVASFTFGSAQVSGNAGFVFVVDDINFEWAFEGFGLVLEAKFLIVLLGAFNIGGICCGGFD